MAIFPGASAPVPQLQWMPHPAPMPGVPKGLEYLSLVSWNLKFPQFDIVVFKTISSLKAELIHYIANIKKNGNWESAVPLEQAKKSHCLMYLEQKIKFLFQWRLHPKPSTDQVNLSVSNIC